MEEELKNRPLGSNAEPADEIHTEKTSIHIDGDSLIERNILMNFRDTAKELNIVQTEFVDWLISHGYIYRNNKNSLKPSVEYIPTLFQIKKYTRSKYTGNQILVTSIGREIFKILINKSA